MKGKKLPRLMLVTQSSLMQPNFLDEILAAVEGGARLIQLREKEMEGAELLGLSRQAKEICDAHGARLLINGNGKIAREIGIGLHLSESNSVAEARRLWGWEYSLGQSVHSREAAQRAEGEGADYFVFGSIFPTASHAGSTPQGLEALRELTRGISIPVFAIGGISSENCLQCLEAGAHGVAVMRAVWQAPNMAQAVQALKENLQD